MLTPDALRVVTLMSGNANVGKSTAAINLASALARCGRDVLLIDENAGAGNVGAALDLKARFELADVINGDVALEQALLHAPHGLRVLPAARGAQAMSV